MPQTAVIGNLCVDDVLHPDGREVRGAAGGSALFGALGLRLWTRDVGVVARAGRGYPIEALEAMRRAGIDMAGVVPFDGPAVHNLIDHRGESGRRLTRLAGSPWENAPRPGDWPAAWRGVEAAHLAALPVEIQAEWLDFFASRGVAVSLDPHLQSCTEDREVLRSALARCDFFNPSDLELRALMPGLPLADAAREVDPWSRQGAVVKCAARGVFAPRQGGWLAACPVDRVVDPTGAGDAYGATFIWAWRETGDVAAAHRRAAVAAALMIEGDGALHTLAMAEDAAPRRLAAWEVSHTSAGRSI